jgi:hypothetical protein
MAQLNMMPNQWNMQHSQWMGSNFNGSNMSLNLPPQQFMHNEMSHGGMWNPWMQQYPCSIVANGI